MNENDRKSMDMNDIIQGGGRTEQSAWRNQQQQQQQQQQPSSLISVSATMVQRQLAAAALQQQQMDQAMAQRRAANTALINLPPSLIGSQQDLSATDEMRQILLSNNARGENLTGTGSRGTTHQSLLSPTTTLAREARHHINMQALDSIASRPPQMGGTAMDGLTLSSQGGIASLRQQQQQLLTLGLPSARAASTSSSQGLLERTQGLSSSLNHQDFQQQRQSLNRLLSGVPTSSSVALAQERELQLQLLLQAQIQQDQAMNNNTMGVSRQQIGSSYNLGHQQLSALTESMLMEQAAARQRLATSSQQQPNSLARLFPQEQLLLTGDVAASTAQATTTGSRTGGGTSKNSATTIGTDDDEDEDDEQQFEAFLKSLPNVERKRRPYDHEAFPSKLYRMLEEVEKKGLAHIVSFTQSGKAFKVHIPGVFEEQIGPVYFRHKQYPSFRRQLSTYGFQRVSKGRNTGAFYHKLFRRGRPDLLPKILRVSELRKDEQELLFPKVNHGASSSGKARRVSSKKRKGSEHLDADGAQQPAAKHSR